MMARKSFRRSESGGPEPIRKAWAKVYENMGIGRNSSFFAVKRTKKEERSWRGGDYGSIGLILWPEIFLGDPGSGDLGPLGRSGLYHSKIWIKYDIRNHSHHSTMIVPHFLCFSAKKLEFRPIPIFSCAIAHAFRVGRPPQTRIA